MKQLSLQLLFGVVLFPAVACCDPVYKWVDETGVVHYGHQPPLTVETVETLELKAASVDPALSQSAQQEMQRLVERVQQLEAARRTREQQDQEERVRTLQAAYYQRLLREREAQPVRAEPTERLVWAMPYYGYYPYHPHRDYVHRRYSPHVGLQISIGRFYYPKPHRPHRHYGTVHGHRGGAGSSRPLPGPTPRPAGLSGMLAGE
jgi:hypothetical protein